MSGKIYNDVTIDLQPSTKSIAKGNMSPAALPGVMYLLDGIEDEKRLPAPIMKRPILTARARRQDLGSAIRMI